MKECPKCGAKLKLTDWRPECPKCGVNMIYYGMEAELEKDAERAEAEHVRFVKKMDRLKASLIGGPLQIARIVFALLPIAGLFLPLAEMRLGEGPFMAARDVKVTILTVVDYFSNLLDVNGLMTMMRSHMLGRTFQYFTVALLGLVLCVVLGLFAFFRLICSAKRKSCVKNVIISVMQLCLIAAAAFAFKRFSAGINYIFPAYISAALAYGTGVYAALHIPTLLANLIFAIKPMKVKYTHETEEAETTTEEAEQ